MIFANIPNSQTKFETFCFKLLFNLMRTSKSVKSNF